MQPETGIRNSGSSVEEEAWFDETSRRWKQKQDGFLSACGLKFEDTNEFERFAKTVPLETFLKAIKPEKTVSIRAKWLEFWKYETTEVIPNLHGGILPHTSNPYKLPSEPKGNINALFILNVWSRFADFIERSVEMELSTRGKKGPEAKKIYAAATAELGEKPSPAQQEILWNLKPGEVTDAINRYAAAKTLLHGKPSQEQKNLLMKLDSNQIENAIMYLNMEPKDAGKLRAVIEDLKTPPKGRPRRTEHKDDKTQTKPAS